MSPLKIRHLPHSRKVRVYDGKRVIAKETTLENAESQMRLINGLKHGMKLRKKD